MVVPLAARDTVDACPPDASSRAVPVMKWWVLDHNISCNAHHQPTTTSHPQAAKLFDQLVDVTYDNSCLRSAHVMIMVLTIPWRRSLPQPPSTLSRAQMQMRSPFAVMSTRRSEAPIPVCFLTGLSTFLLQTVMGGETAVTGSLLRCCSCSERF
jgi:hypothetical protein